MMGLGELRVLGFRVSGSSGLKLEALGLVFRV